ncbi:PPR domain-containing protein/PPR_2 domain-containing protein/PPR_3 domain-containing protein [Cephalotus follicularis]|uniref:PPR domain-containing protein/PPR_2 domain-containing protein/PPR_3 domain-containing protein n=1 Tax=Cephalotus follicularis TaxID=3775 RepID=A0A1Q3B619_CEPFO|nr:PPR domain-containing protein/PPR_2 domain-containing protein/PPR_3 domain-containing protein [Cephalotus follicularis]
MHRTLARVPLRSLADCFCESKPNSKPHQNKRRNVAEKLEVSRTLTTANGGEFWLFGEKSTRKSMQMQIVDALHSNERSRASNLLLKFVHESYSLGADDFVCILNYCANSPDPLFVMETWKVMQEKEIGLDDKCYLLMMRALCRGGYLQEASNLMSFLGGHGISPMLPVYNSFLKACAKMRSILHANQCLDLMEHRAVGRNEVTYNEILKLALWQKNLSAVHGIWKDYIKHYSLSITALRKFIRSFTRLRDLKSAYETLQDMVALAIRTRLSRTAGERSCYSRLDIPIPLYGDLSSQKVTLDESKHFVALEMETHSYNAEQCTLNLGNKEIQSTKIGMPSKHENLILRRSFNDVIHACAQTQNCELAEMLMQQMQSLGLRPSRHTYDGFVRAVVSKRGLNDGMEVLKIMRQMNLKPLDSTLATLSISCSRALELDLAEVLLDQISDRLYPHPHNALLAACDVMDQPERAVRILTKMKQHCAKRIKTIEMDMVKNNVQHSHLSMKNLLKALGAEGMTRELIQYLRVAENLFSRNNIDLGTSIYNAVLHSLVEAREVHMVIEIFKKMKPCGVLPNAATYDIMIDCCSVIICFKSACALVSMMLRDGFYPTTLTYTTLIKILLKYENFCEAMNLLDQASSEGVQLDVLLYNTILQKACEKGRIDVIEFIVEQMHQERVQPDPSTCQYVFTAYVNCGFHNTAAEALQVLSLRMICEEDSSFQEQRKEFDDNSILAEDSETELRIVRVFKASDVNLATALLNLRWCAIVGFPVSWSPKESAWAKRLSANYETRTRTG